MLSPEDKDLRRRMTGEMHRHESLDSFRLMVRREYDAAAGNKVRQSKIVEFWANHLVVTFNAYDESNRLIDSVLAVPESPLSPASRQSLEVRRFSNISDLRHRDQLAVYRDTFLSRIREERLRLNDTIDYFILATVFGEIKDFSTAQQILQTVAYHARDNHHYSWRAYLTMAYMYLGVHDYEKALAIVPRFLELTDTSRYNAAVCGSAYYVASEVYYNNDQHEQAHRWAKTALDFLMAGQVFELNNSRVILCQTALALGHSDKQSACKPVLRQVADTTLPNVVRENLLYCAISYGLDTGFPMRRLDDYLTEWAALRAAGEKSDNYLNIALAETSLRIELRRQGDRSGEVLLDSLQSLYTLRVKDKATAINNDLAERYQTRIRRDSIANLMLRSEVAETRATNRKFQLWFVLGLLTLMGTGMLFALRESRRRKSLNAQLLAKNEEINRQAVRNSRLASSVHHSTGNYLKRIINLLKLQRRRGKRDGADVSVTQALERQTLAFRRLQQQPRGEEAYTVDVGRYLREYCRDLELAFTDSTGRPAIAISHNVVSQQVPVTFAGDLGLILQELVTNSFKYADRAEGVVRIDLDLLAEADGSIRLIYRDGGPRDGEVNPDNYSTSLGMALIRDLTSDRDGDLVRYGTEDSYDYEAVFPLENAD